MGIRVHLSTWNSEIRFITSRVFIMIISIAPLPPARKSVGLKFFVVPLLYVIHNRHWANTTHRVGRHSVYVICICIRGLFGLFRTPVRGRADRSFRVRDACKHAASESPISHFPAVAFFSSSFLFCYLFFGLFFFFLVCLSFLVVENNGGGGS